MIRHRYVEGMKMTGRRPTACHSGHNHINCVCFRRAWEELLVVSALCMPFVSRILSCHLIFSSLLIQLVWKMLSILNVVGRLSMSHKRTGELTKLGFAYLQFGIHSYPTRFHIADRCSSCRKTKTTGPEIIKLFSCSAQPSMTFHLVIKIKIPKIKTVFMLNSAEHAQLSWAWKKFKKIVSILRFISKIKSMLIWVEHEKRFINSGPGFTW